MAINLNILETNLINLVIVIGVLFWFLKGFLGGILERRRNSILEELQAAETRLIKANQDLEIAKSELAAAKQKADKIRLDGKTRAESIRLEGEKNTIAAMASVKEGAVADTEAETARIITDLRREAALNAIQNVIEKLPSEVDESAQSKLIEASLNNLGES